MNDLILVAIRASLVLALLLGPTSAQAITILNNLVKSTAGAGSLTSDPTTMSPGSTIAIVACSKSGISLDFTTSGGDTPTYIDFGPVTPGGGTARVGYFQNIIGGPTYTVTATPGGGTPTITMVGFELGNVLTSGVFDTNGLAIENITPASTTMSSGATGTLDQADEIAIGYICTDSGIAATLTADTGNGWTLASTELAGGTKMVAGLQFKITGGTSPVTSVWTTDNTTGRSGVATFKGASGAAAAPAHLTLMGVGQ